MPGDKITVTYDDPRVITEGSEVHEATLAATFHNATLSACFIEYTGEGAQRRARYIPLRRFKPGDKVSVYVADPDCDTTDKPDTVKFAARTLEGKPVEFPALETAEHSGIFVGGIFPVGTDPKRESEVRVAAGDDLLVAYLDKENTDPGIPWERTCLVEQTVWAPPRLCIYEVASRPLTEEELAAAAEAATAGLPSRARSGEPTVAQGGVEEGVPVTRALTASWPETPDAAKPTPVFINGPLLVELTFPYVAQSPESTATLYVQTSSGRKAHGKPPEGDFDVKVPGTLKLEATPGNAPTGLPAPPGYKSVTVKASAFAGDALEDGRFTFSVPAELGKIGAAAADPDAKEKPVLAIKGNDEVFVGLEYKEPGGQTKWLTARAVLQADAFFDVTDPRYRETVEGIYVGESLHFRVMDPIRDTTDEKDTLAIELKTAAGAAQKLDLTETFTHSGVFKGSVKVAFQGDKAEAKGPGVLAVTYGDKVTAAYTRADGKEKLERAVAIHKGSNGDVVPFTKRFADPQIAVQTQFSIAEAFFELAKRHRELGQEDLARDEIAQGKKLLEEAIRDFPDTEARAQADYLLADLALEFASEMKDEDAKKKNYMELVVEPPVGHAIPLDEPVAPVEHVLRDGEARRDAHPQGVEDVQGHEHVALPLLHHLVAPAAVGLLEPEHDLDGPGDLVVNVLPPRHVAVDLEEHERAPHVPVHRAVLVGVAGHYLPVVLHVVEEELDAFGQLAPRRPDARQAAVAHQRQAGERAHAHLLWEILVAPAAVRGLRAADELERLPRHLAHLGGQELHRRTLAPRLRARRIDECADDPLLILRRALRLLRRRAERQPRRHGAHGEEAGREQAWNR